MSDCILTFDLSLKRSAFACCSDGVIKWGSRSFIEASDPKLPDLRFNEYRKWLVQLIGTTNPTAVIYEKPTTHGQGSGEAQIMLEMTLRELCAVRGIRPKYIYPASLKLYITGSGRAEKPQMMAVIAAKFPGYDPTQDVGGDIADALGLLVWARDGCPPSQTEIKRAEKKTVRGGDRLAKGEPKRRPTPFIPKHLRVVTDCRMAKE